MRITWKRSLATVLALVATVMTPAAIHGAPASAAAAVVGPLTVQGNQVVDGNGNPITLRGIHRDRPQSLDYGTSSNPLVADAEIDAMKAWGANVVRVPVSSALWLPGCPFSNPAYGGPGGYVDQLVSKINADGMVAIVDLHEISNKSCATPGRWAAPNGSAVEFWSQAAALFANRPLVAFELFNEPQVGDAATWQAGQQSLYDAAEATGARNLVIIDADSAATNPTAIVTGHAINDTNHNIAYAVHPYTCTDPDDQACINNVQSHRANTTVLTRFVPVSALYPIVATEFGWPNPPDTGADFYSSTYQFLDSQHPAWGSIAFGWNGTLTGRFHMLSSLAPSYSPNITGQAVKSELSGQP